MVVGIDKFAKHINDFQYNNWDCVLVVSGETGSSKSSLAYQLARRVGLNTGVKFKFKEHIVYTREEFSEKVKNIEQYGTLMVDEAINVFFSRDAMKSGQKELLRYLELCRDKNLFLILIVPNFWSIDGMIRNNKIKYWAYCYQRGYATLFTPDRQPFIRDPWHCSENEKMLKNWTKGADSRRSRNYVDTVRFGKPPERMEQLYLAVKAEKREGSEIDGEEVKTYSQGAVDSSYEKGVKFGKIMMYEACKKKKAKFGDEPASSMKMQEALFDMKYKTIGAAKRELKKLLKKH